MPSHRDIWRNRRYRLLIQPNAGAWPSTDGSFSSVVGLLHFDGANGSTTFTDVKGKTFTRVGSTAVLSTAEAVWGGSSLRLNGSAERLTTADHADWHFGAGDWTIETWIRFVALPTGNAHIVGQYNATTNQRSWLLQYVQSTGQLNITTSTNGLATAGLSMNWSPALNTWYHIAASCASGVGRLFVGGVAEATTFSPGTLHNSTASMDIGNSASGGGANLNCYLDDLRISKGVARYTGNYTVPYGAFQDS